MDSESARNAIMAGSGFLTKPLGRRLLGRSLIVFRQSWWHVRRRGVVAQLTVRGSDPGSIVALRLARTRFQSVFISLFAVVALGGPLAVLLLEFSWPSAKLPWWSFLEGLLQDTAIYAGCMALNAAFVRRD